MEEQVIPEITAEAIVSCIEALSKKEGNIDYLASYIDRTSQYTKRAIIMGIQLGLFEEKDEKIFLSQYCALLLPKFRSNFQILFREALLNYKPFILLADYILKDNLIEDSVRKTKVVFDLNSSNEKIIIKTFTNFCKYLGLTGLSKDSLTMLFSNSKPNIEYINSLISKINNNFESQIFISEKLGQGGFNYITDPERKLLSDSLINLSIDDAAGAFESFLRRIGKDKNINLENSNGIGEVADVLASKKNLIILSEHRIMCHFIGSFRNPDSHKVQKTILELWKIEKDSSMEIILLILTVMKSIYYYVFEKKLIL
ncbi:MAG: hypothetical protein PHQ66_02460 [Candidatus Nanoarchaeia archaeon]|nr:hypothetical protein [Candidatus Nanoarchaeia archaeon]MDD5357770.1 hypothetical protein [Candidatus Nanoarchaeia archaeon]MDD5588689.1 hypothetical protein [Candidatus Nanoarchaeia archaeon]